MRACVFKTFGLGKGHALTKDKQLICTGCKSADHDSYNCSFFQIPGWLGFKPDGQNNTMEETDFMNGNKDFQCPILSMMNTRDGRRGGDLRYRGQNDSNFYRGRG